MICSVVMGALTLHVSNCSIAPIFCRPFCVVDGSAAWSFAPMQRRLRSAFSVADTSVRLRVKLERGLEGPLLPLNVDHSDTVFVLKVKIEIALRLLQDTGNLRSKVVPKAEEIELEFRGVPLRDMMAIDRYSINTGNELIAYYSPQPLERDTVFKDPAFVSLEDLIIAEQAVLSKGMIKRILTRTGKLCTLCWRGRWFRATVLEVYSTSLLCKWLDWPETEWPAFFLHVSLATAPGKPPDAQDETWRLRWHLTKPVSDLPIVQPHFIRMPRKCWVRAFLRTYAKADEMAMLRELQAFLPREIGLDGEQLKRQRVVVLGSSGVGKTTLIEAFCKGPPQAGGLLGGIVGSIAGDAAGMSLYGGSIFAGIGDSMHGRTTHTTSTSRGPLAPRFGRDLADVLEERAGYESKAPYWPTMGTTCHEASVTVPGSHPLSLLLLDTSGNPRYKALSLVVYKQAHVVLLVFDVKSMRSFRALSEVGGWLHEFSRLTGLTPKNFPFVLVGNKAEDEVMRPRQVFEEDVREWMLTCGARMPYLETSFGGDPRQAWHHAEHVFRTVARSAQRLKENLGMHIPPSTPRVPPEADHGEGEHNFAKWFRGLAKNGFKKVFETWDEDGSGKLDAAEFRKAFKSLEPSSHVTEAQVDALFDRLDRDRSGSVNYNEIIEEIQGDDFLKAAMGSKPRGFSFELWAKQTGDSLRTFDIKKAWEEGVSQLKRGNPRGEPPTAGAGAATGGANSQSQPFNPLDCVRLAARRKDGSSPPLQTPPDPSSPPKKLSSEPSSSLNAASKQQPALSRAIVTIADGSNLEQKTASRKGVSTSKLRSVLIKSSA